MTGCHLRPTRLAVHVTGHQVLPLQSTSMQGSVVMAPSKGPWVK